MTKHDFFLSRCFPRAAFGLVLAALYSAACAIATSDDDATEHLSNAADSGKQDGVIDADSYSLRDGRPRSFGFVCDNGEGCDISVGIGIGSTLPASPYMLKKYSVIATK